MITATKLFFKNYVNFSGRSTRSEYWWPMLSLGIIEAILYGIFYGALFYTAAAETDSAGPLVTVVMILLIVLSLAVVIPSVSVTVRRLHDTGRSGWWYFIALVPCIGSIIFLIFMCTDSQPGDNQWGPNPKGIYQIDQTM